MFLTGRKIHFMGAGGIGVSALAMLALRYGAQVTACDRSDNEMIAMLKHEGIKVYSRHDPCHVANGEMLVYTSAVPENHPERLAAKNSVRRGVFLASLMNRKEAWGVAGTHGKTTTSWLLASIAIEAGLGPTVFIGGAVPELGGRNFLIGDGPFIAELDESDGSFLEPQLKVAVLTNVESDHLSHYGDDTALFDAFVRYAKGVEENGLLVAGADSPVSERIFRKHSGRKISFGITEPADVTARSIHFEKNGGMTFNATVRGKDAGQFAITLTGKHNIQNSLAALAVAVEMGVDLDEVRRALAKAKSVGRRMERVGDYAGAAVYSDYAHHPTEVMAAISAFRSLYPGKTLVVFQPHLFSRTRDYADAFAEALGKADMVLLVDIYPAREEPIPGVTSALLADKAEKFGAKVFGPVPVADAAAEAGRLAAGCEAVVMMGAGDIDAAARELAGLS